MGLGRRRIDTRLALGALAGAFLASIAPDAFATRPAPPELPLEPWSRPSWLEAEPILGDTLEHRFPARFTGPVVTTHVSSGLNVSWRPRGLSVLRADGSTTELAQPAAVPAIGDTDGGLSYRDVYPGVSQRYLVGASFVTLELTLEAPLGGDLAAGDTLLLTWGVEMDQVGMLVTLGATGGGFILLDREQNPRLLLRGPRVREREEDAAAPDTPPPATYIAELVEGQILISVAIAADELRFLPPGEPLIVDATTLDLPPVPAY